eukprot:6214659-Pleurochrysis_carterae.AAC.2
MFHVAGPRYALTKRHQYHWRDATHMRTQSAYASQTKVAKHTDAIYRCDAARAGLLQNANMRSITVHQGACCEGRSWTLRPMICVLSHITASGATLRAR